MEDLIQRLKDTIAGEVYGDTFHRSAYSVDASIFEVSPKAIVVPKHADDIAQTLKIAREEGLSVTPRGAATGITGGCLGDGIIIDTSKHLNKILEINLEKGYALCEPGVIQDDLNKALSTYGLRLGPDTSTGNRATLGGMLANNAAGARSLHYGKMVDHILEVEGFLASGQEIHFRELDETELHAKTLQHDAEGKIYRTIQEVRTHYGEEIRNRFPHITRRVSGYNLDELIKSPGINLSKLIAGSEGTLMIITKMKVRIVHKPKGSFLCLIHLDDLIEGLHAVPEILTYSPLSLEMIDKAIMELGKLAPSLVGKLDWLSEVPNALFFAEFETEEAAVRFHKNFASAHPKFFCTLLTDPVAIQNLLDVRKSGLGLLLSRRTYSRAIAFLEDISLPPERLPGFMAEFISYLNKNDKAAGIYGHVGAGCMHIRPFVDLRDASEVQLLRKMMEDVARMLLKEGGALSGEHGDGLIRSWLNPFMFGKELYKAFCIIKKEFDPQGRLNPGKIVEGPPPEENLRLSPSTKIRTIKTFLDFSKEGGFALAADLCNGNGQCRKKEGVMCPSFQATSNEFDTTRARAQALRQIINGKLPLDSLTGDEIQSIFDLCIECKGCKKECPSQVDMAKMKAELLYQHQEKVGYSVRSRLFGNIHSLFKVGSFFARLLNPLMNTRVVKRILSKTGIAPERTLPRLANQRFSTWFHKHPKAASPKKVVLFNDTYTEFCAPSIGIAAVTLLEALGYEVILPPLRCCGRPLISKGLLKQAKESAEMLVETLFPYATQGLPIVTLEPSCFSALADDFKGLLGYDVPPLQRILETLLPFEEFLANQLVDGKLPLPLRPLSGAIHFHGHCHQKSVRGYRSMLKVLRSLDGVEVKEIESGCCGMAGSFGYEKEHYALSMQIGELKLLPSIRQAAEGDLVAANGFSCRSQIKEGAAREPRHLAEIVASVLQPLPR